MRILVISNLYPPHYLGGYELICQTVTEALRARGHKVEVLTSDHGVQGEAGASPGPGNSRGGREAGPGASGVERSLRIHGLFGHPWLNIVRLQQLERWNNNVLRSALRRVEPDLVYIWNCSGLGKSLLFTLQKLNVPTTFCICDHWIIRSAKSDVWLRWWNLSPAPLQHRLLRALFSLAGFKKRWLQVAPATHFDHLVFRRIHFCSRALRAFTASAGFDVDHGAVIYCPLSTTRFKGLPRLASQPLKRLLYVGRLTPDKGVMTALRAMALARNKFPGHLSIYGRGEHDYEAKLKTFVQQSKLPVTFAGICQPDEMPAVYDAHDALLFTSEWPEPFALTPLEAMGSGLAVIGTTTGGSGELFRHGENALIYTAGSAEELARRILQLDGDNHLRARIAANGYQEVRHRFSEPVIVDQIEDYLRETHALWPPELQ